MKKSNLFFSILISLLIFSSCSSDDNSNGDDSQSTDLKPSSYTVVEADGDNWRLNFQYSGNLISKITTDYGTTITYNYNGDQLSSYTTVRNGQSETTNLTYENNRLIESRTEDDSEVIAFSYNSSGQINRTDWTENGFTETTFYEYDNNGNVIQSEDDFSIFKYIYDNNNNAFRNVFPQLDAEVQWEWFGSQINNQIEVQEKLSNESTFSTKYTYEYDFNENNYPTQRRQIRNDGTIRETVNYTY